MVPLVDLDSVDTVHHGPTLLLKESGKHTSPRASHSLFSLQSKKHLVLAAMDLRLRVGLQCMQSSRAELMIERLRYRLILMIAQNVGQRSRRNCQMRSFPTSEEKENISS